MKQQRIAATAIALSFLVVACGSEDGADGTTTGGSTPESILNGEIKCDQQYAGKKVTVFSPVRNSENDKPVDDLVAAYQPLVDCTGVEIAWEGTDQFETEINVRLEGGNAPDVIDFPQPGLMASLARKGSLKALPDAVAAHVKDRKSTRLNSSHT